jgi:hypothetical protein
MKREGAIKNWWAGWDLNPRLSLIGDQWITYAGDRVDGRPRKVPEELAGRNHVELR